MAFGGAAAAVTGAKQRQVGRMAAEFLARRALGDRPCRFDVVAIDFARGATRIEVYPNAFVLG
jgi:Holliday junction resolvase-like predicted endonuclease